MDANSFWLDLLEERYEAAEHGYGLALEVDRGLGHIPWAAGDLRGLGLARLGLGRRAEARTVLLSALELLAADATPGVDLTTTLLWIALAVEPGDGRSAARLVGAVDAVRQKARLSTWPGEVELRRRFEPPLIDALGEGDWAREQAAGATLRLDEAIELARTLGAGPPETARPSA